MKKLQDIFILAMQTNQKYIFSDKILISKNKTLEFNLASANYIYNSNWSQLLKYIKPYQERLKG